MCVGEHYQIEGESFKAFAIQTIFSRVSLEFSQGDHNFLELELHTLQVPIPDYNHGHRT